MHLPELKPIPKAEYDRSQNRLRADKALQDIERIENAISSANQEELEALHIELDGTYQASVRGWGDSMYGFSKGLGFNYEFVGSDALKHNLKTMIGKLRGYVQQIYPEAELRRQKTTGNEVQPMNKSYSKEKVFIVHGHDEHLLQKVELLLRRIGLEPIILKNEANTGLTIIEKIEKYTDVGYGIVLYTCCDVGMNKDGNALRDRARQNVVFEHGYLFAKLGRGRVAALNDSKVEVPSDLSGVIYISLDDDSWEKQLMKEMKAAGLSFEAAKA